MRIKKLLIIGLLFVFSLAFAGDENPYRYSKMVSDCTQGYNAEFIVSPEEEPRGDQTVSNAPECDILGVLSCFDDDQLRVDILLNHSVSYNFIVWYAIEFEYIDSKEYYTYYPTEEELYYEVEIDGKITHKEQLGSSAKDYAGVTSQDNQEAGSVYIIIDKDEHIAGQKGEVYYLTMTVYSGYIDSDDNFQIADQTITVDMEFQK